MHYDVHCVVWLCIMMYTVQWQKLSEENNLKDFGRQNLGTRFAQKWMKIGLGIQQKVLIYIANTVHIFNNNFV